MTNKERGLLAGLSDEIAGAVERASKYVVTVKGRRRFPASGIVWPGGVVVTADHVLERDEDITVSLNGEQDIAATLVGRDPGSDIAVLKLATPAPTVAELAPADATKVGNFVLAVGRPGAGSPMASFGVVSALGAGSWRTARGGVQGYIRADVALYPGFSGGPLIDSQGRVVGINSSQLAGGESIAVPVTALQAVVQALLTQGRVRRAYLGISSQPVALPTAVRQKLKLEQESGLMIVRVEPGSPADKGGLFMGDVVIKLGAGSIDDPQDLQAALRPDMVGKPTPITVLRGGDAKTVTVTPGERE